MSSDALPWLALSLFVVMFVVVAVSETTWLARENRHVNGIYAVGARDAGCGSLFS